MEGSRVEVRRARGGDTGGVAALAAELAHSFPFSRDKFDLAYPALVASEDTCLLVAAEGDGCLGYVLGFRHLTFYANGPVGWTEEILVRPECRGQGLGRTLMSAFEQWAARRDCMLVALATRWATPFYRALGYEDSAAYLRKVLPRRAPWSYDGRPPCGHPDPADLAPAAP